MTADVSGAGPSSCPATSGSGRLLECYQQALGHELPNQLVAIQGMARLLQMEAGGRLSGEAEGFLTRLVQLTQETHTFVNAVSEIGRCCRPAAASSFSLADVWEEIAAEVKKQFPERDVRCRTVGPLPTVVLPFAAVRRVFSELVRAAIRRAPPDSPLTIACTAEQATDGVRVRLQDDGPPPNALHQQQLFDPFVATPGQKGPTVGLFLARELAEGWGGSLEMASADGGCTTTIEFPVRVPAKPK